MGIKYKLKALIKKNTVMRAFFLINLIIILLFFFIFVIKNSHG